MAAAWSHRWTLASAAFCFATLTGARRSYPTPASRLIDRAALSASGVSSATQDTADTHRALRRRIARFEDTWREAWQAAAEPFAPSTDLRNLSAASRRHWAIDCYRRTPTAVPVQLPIPVPRRPIVGNGGAVCPAWSPPDAEPRADEGESIDLALTLAHAAAVRRSRDALLRELATASAANPNDAWITGQRVRFLIDQQQFPQAVAVARACAGDSALCADLAGMAYHYAGDIVAADSAFRDAEALRSAGRSVNAPADDRDSCHDSTVSQLLTPNDTRELQALTCEQQREVVRNVWWLSDPLWAVAGNERYVAHGVRRVQTLVRAANPRDERYVWERNAGGGAVQEMVQRYGWPSFTYWPGAFYERDFARTIERPQTSVSPRPGVSSAGRGGRVLPPARLFPLRTYHPPLTAKEYAPDRVALVPAFAALRDPFALNASHFDLYNPSPENTDGWWPQEHMALAATLLPLDAGQDVSWRRDRAIAYHLAVDDPLTRVSPTDTNPYPAALIGGTSEYNMRAVAQSDVRRGNVMRLSAALSSTPIVLSAELFVRITPAVAHRRRYGVRLPPTLAEMRPGDVALSDLLFMRLPSRTTNVPDQPDEAARLMAGSLSFERTLPLAVYWESYGLAASDTVDVEVRVRRDNDISVARRIGAALGAVSSLRDSISIRWREPDARRGTTAIAARTPVIGRSLSLEVSELPPGTYLLAIEIRKGTRNAVRTERRFTLRD